MTITLRRNRPQCVEEMANVVKDKVAAKVLKNRLNKEGSESVTKCHRLKLEAADGKKYLTDVADPETLLRLI
jgi:hypothetical protein